MREFTLEELKACLYWFDFVERGIKNLITRREQLALKEAK